jgi:hypothetical protein
MMSRGSPCGTSRVGKRTLDRSALDRLRCGRIGRQEPLGGTDAEGLGGERDRGGSTVEPPASARPHRTDRPGRRAGTDSCGCSGRRLTARHRRRNRGVEAPPAGNVSPACSTTSPASAETVDAGVALGLPDHRRPGGVTDLDGRGIGGGIDLGDDAGPGRRRRLGEIGRGGRLERRRRQRRRAMARALASARMSAEASERVGEVRRWGEEAEVGVVRGCWRRRGGPSPRR